MSTAALVLAAGQSRRFGAADKLLAPLPGGGGRRVLDAALAALCGLAIAGRLTRRLAVVASPAVADAARAAGFEALHLPAGQPQSASLTAGLAALRQGPGQPPARVLIVLGDMPFLRPADLAALLDLAGADRDACAELDGTPLPPAVLTHGRFAEIAALTGDRGAGVLLRAVPPACRLPLPAGRLRDIDRPSDLLPGQDGANGF